MKIRTVILLLCCFFALPACEDSEQEAKLIELGKKIDRLFESVSNDISALKSQVEDLKKDDRGKSESQEEEVKLLIERVEALQTKLAQFQESDTEQFIDQNQLEGLKAELSQMIVESAENSTQNEAQMDELQEQMTSFSAAAASLSQLAELQTQVSKLEERVAKLSVTTASLNQLVELQRQITDIHQIVQARPVVVRCKCKNDIVNVLITGAGEDKSSAEEDANQTCNVFIEHVKTPHPHQLIECSTEAPSVPN